MDETLVKVQRKKALLPDFDTSFKFIIENKSEVKVYSYAFY